MPALFYTKKQAGHYVGTRPGRDAKADLDAVVSFLRFSKKKASRAYATARGKIGKVDVRKGQSIFQAMNCVACHRNQASRDDRLRNAPSLATVAVGTRDEYLQSHLRKPSAIRPFGFLVGSGGRMPDFRLDPAEQKLLFKEIKKLASNKRLKPAPAPQKLSAFQKQKAQKLVSDKLSCLGCHELNGEGGRVAPRLDDVGQRRTYTYIHNILNHPRETVPTTVMPKIRLGQPRKLGSWFMIG